MQWFSISVSVDRFFCLIVFVSGNIGFLFEHLAIRRQSQWDALPYACIADQRARIAGDAESLLKSAILDVNAPGLVGVYSSLTVFFSQPANFIAHCLGSEKPVEKLLSRLNHAGRSMEEHENLIRLRELVLEKNNLDKRWTLFWLQRGFLFVHVPVSTMVIIFVVTHIILVYAYRGGGI